MESGNATLPLDQTRAQVKTIAGKYELIRLLGQGGMGAVYEGKNQVTLKRCAIKLLLSQELAGTPSIVKRFFREAKASSVIESDHIVTIYDSGTDPATGYPFMVMELLQGEDLEQIVRRLGALQPIGAAKLILQAAMGLARAHELNIVHRDIKPANLYLTQRELGDYVVKLLDFGIAKVKMENFAETSQGLTRTGSMLGTPLYMSPEQARGASDIDPRSDVWSLGVVLYELLSGSIPFSEATSLGELMVAIITEDLPLLQDRAPWVPPELAEVTHRAMSRDVAQRYAHAGELRDALAALMPEGPQITEDMLMPVPHEQRTYVAPRLQLSSDGMLRATTKTGLSQTGDEGATLPPRKKRAAPVVASMIAGVAVLSVGVGVGLKYLAGEPAPSTTASAPAPVARDEPRPTPEDPIVTRAKRFRLRVPDGVDVSVDGEPASVERSEVELVGAPGATREVVLSHDGESERHVVAITDEGLLPPALEWTTRTPPPAKRRPARRPTRPHAKAPARAAAPASVPTKAPATKTEAPKPAVGVVKNTDEFD